MSRNSSKIIKVKLSVIGIAVALAIFCLLSFPTEYQKVSASASGPTNSHTNAPGEANCTVCHSQFPVNSGSGNISITGLPKNYLPNQQIPVTVTINDQEAVTYGFQLTAIDSQGKKIGTYTLPGQNPPPLQTVNGIVDGNQREYIEHTLQGITPTQFGTKSWTFMWNAPGLRAGKVSFYVAGNASDSSNDTSGDYIYTTNGGTLSGSGIANFDMDLKSDISVWRPSTGVWYSLNSTDGNFQAAQFGANGDKIASGDYDGDGKSDFAVFRPSQGVWYIQKSSGGSIITQFGSNGDIPVVGDYDGDGKSDLAVWRPTNGVWYILRSSDGSFDIRQFGSNGDKIAQGDYDADGKTDLAVWRPSNGAWYVLRSTDGNFSVTPFGISTDKPVQGDYDGDGKTDFAIYRSTESTWYLLRSRDGFTAAQFGASTDLPSPADFDADGKTDLAVFRPSNGVWYILRSGDNGFTITQFGSNGDIPVPRGYLTN